MIKKKSLALLAALVLFSGVSFAGTSDEFMFSGSLLSSDEFPVAFDMNTFGLGSHLDGTYKASFDVFSEVQNMPQGIALISTGNSITGGVFFGDGMPGMDLNGDSIASSTFMFNAEHGTEYFASVLGGFNGETGYKLHIALVPEMETWAMMAAGLGFLGWRLRNKEVADKV